MSYGPPPPGNPGPPPPPGGGYGPPSGGYGPPPGGPGGGYGPPGGGYGPPSGGYGPPSGGYGGYGGQQPSSEPPKNFLVFNILGLFSCSFILAIIGLIFALQVNSKWQMGDYAGAESSASVAKILGILSFIGFCLSLAYFIFTFVMIGIVGMSEI